MKRLFVVGLGPGGRDGMTLEAKKALEQSEVICGYTAYADLIREDYPEKEYLVSGMTKEVERCHMALLAAQDGKTTAMICSGDAGVYGMAGLVLSLAEKYPETEVVIVAGVTAALSGAARLGAPLMNDFAVISLSDLLTPKDVIEKRLRAAAAGDFSICLYNPSSKKRADYLSWACRIVSEYYAPDTPCGWVRMIGRQDEEKKTCTLQELTKEQVDMFTTVFIGSSRTSFQNGLLVTKRGYEKRVAVNRAGGKEKLRILLFGGTTEGRELAQRLLTLPVIFKVSVATPYGEELLQDLPQATILAGRMDRTQMEQEMEKGYDLVIDATHPYAAEVSENIRQAAQQEQIRLLRVCRRASKVGSDCYWVQDAKEAAGLLQTLSGNILLTTGSKELVAFEGVEKERLYVRVLPSKEALDLCEKAQIPHSHILALQGPFTTALNIALMEQYHIGILVTKDGGKKGGFLEKQEAARLQKAALVVIGRPTQEEGYSVEEAWNLVLESLYAKGGAGGYAQVEDNAASGRAKLSTAVEQEQHVYGTKGGAVE